MPPLLLALYAEQFLEIKLFTFDYRENKSQRMVYLVPMFLLDQRFILRWSSPLSRNEWLLLLFC